MASVGGAALPSQDAVRSDLAELGRIHQAKPRTKDVLERFKGRVKYDSPGSTKFTVNLKTRREIQEFREMRDSYRPLAVARALRKNGEIPKVRMRHPANGEVKEVAAVHAPRLEKEGLREVNGRRATHRQVDGRWYRRVGREWVPE